MGDYSATLLNGQSIYIPSWPVQVQLENLTKAGKALGISEVVSMSENSIPSFIRAIMNCEDSNLAASLVKHFVCTVRMDGKKLTPDTIDDIFEGNLSLMAEIFCHVMHSQYHSFFVSGLAEAVSPPNL